MPNVNRGLRDIVTGIAVEDGRADPRDVDERAAVRIAGGDGEGQRVKHGTGLHRPRACDDACAK